MTATIEVYDRMAADYARLADAHLAPGLREWLARLEPGTRVLDLGCGTGRDAALMLAAGLDVLAVDGSAAMVARAAAHPGLNIRQATFDDIPALGTFGGIWASFSLLHAPRADFPRHLADLRAACLESAQLGLGMKTGSGEGLDRLGRFYSYYSEAELRALLAAAGFAVEAAIFGADAGLAGTVDDWLVLLAVADRPPA